MKIQGSNHEHHLELKEGEKASQVRISHGVHQLKQVYEIDRHVLGKGAFGKVYKGIDKNNPEHQVAIKVLSKDKMSKKDQAKVMDEVDLLRKVDHPNIAKYFETYDDKHYLYLVMELCTGGELFDSHDRCVKNGQPYTERMAADVMKKCLSALQHCHALGITHRDIKPENIMFGRDGEVRLVDFGLAKDSLAHMKSYAGTPYFMAPEVLNGSYTHKCDIWSLACVLYMLLAGKLPYTGMSRTEVFDKIKAGAYAPVPDLSPELQSLLSQMFNVEYQQRPTAKEVQTHLWFNLLLSDSEQARADQPISQEVLHGLVNFHGRNRLRRQCLQILVKMVNPREFIDLRREFNKIDTNMSGTIEVDELRKCVRRYSQLRDADIDRTLEEVDLNKMGVINYHEFIAATFPVEEYATEERLRALFSKFET